MTIIKLAAYAATCFILADIAWIVLTQMMWAMDKAQGADDEA